MFLDFGCPEFGSLLYYEFWKGTLVSNATLLNENNVAFKFLVNKFNFLLTPSCPLSFIDHSLTVRKLFNLNQLSWSCHSNVMWEEASGAFPECENCCKSLRNFGNRDHCSNPHQWPHRIPHAPCWSQGMIHYFCCKHWVLSIKSIDQ